MWRKFSSWDGSTRSSPFSPTSRLLWPHRPSHQKLPPLSPFSDTTGRSGIDTNIELSNRYRFRDHPSWDSCGKSLMLCLGEDVLQDAFGGTAGFCLEAEV